MRDVTVMGGPCDGDTFRVSGLTVKIATPGPIDSLTLADIEDPEPFGGGAVIYEMDVEWWSDGSLRADWSKRRLT